LDGTRHAQRTDPWQPRSHCCWPPASEGSWKAQARALKHSPHPLSIGLLWGSRLLPVLPSIPPAAAAAGKRGGSHTQNQPEPRTEPECGNLESSTPPAAPGQKRPDDEWLVDCEKVTRYVCTYMNGRRQADFHSLAARTGPRPTPDFRPYPDIESISCASASRYKRGDATHADRGTTCGPDTLTPVSIPLHACRGGCHGTRHVD
jgi:hypothetical protein